MTICKRCGLTDENLLDIGTGSCCHPEWWDCVAALQERLAIAERQADEGLELLRRCAKASKRVNP